MSKLRYPEQFRITTHPRFLSIRGEPGAFLVPLASGDKVFIIASDGMGWEHVSVSRYTGDQTPPTWDMMHEVKTIFWPDPEDCVVQYHPPASKYVNQHQGVLHLWRPSVGWPDDLIPPTILVGIKK